MSAERALGVAIRDALLADSSIRACLGNPARVFDEPPLDPVFPYATLGGVETRTADASDAAALEHAVTLHVWSRYGGRAEALDVIAAMRDALHDQALDIENRRLVFLFAPFADVFRSGDGRTTHGVLRIRALTEAA